MAVIATHSRRVLLTLACGTCGGALMYGVGAPLAWLLGSFIVCISLALAGVNLHLPIPLRKFSLTVIGLFIGLRFEADTFSSIELWLSSIALLVASTLLTAVIIYLLMTYALRRDPKTTFFCALPGGLSEMVSMAHEFGGDDKTVALIHLSRIVLTVSSLPVVLPLLGIVPAPLPIWTEAGISEALPSLEFILLLAGALTVGTVMGRIGLPAAQLIGAMCLGAVIKTVLQSDVSGPAWLLPAAQIFIGAYIGCRFTKYKFQYIWRTLVIGAALTTIMLAISATSAWLGTYYIQMDYMTLFLSYAPGGVSEIALLALTLDSNATFVSLHHLLRIVFVILVMMVVTALMKRKIDKHETI